jgi:hypothetical protein
MNEIQRLFEQRTGQKATYRKDSSDYHTLKYVQWLEELASQQPNLQHELRRLLNAVNKVTSNYRHGLVQTSDLDFLSNRQIEVEQAIASQQPTEPDVEKLCVCTPPRYINSAGYCSVCGGKCPA